MKISKLFVGGLLLLAVAFSIGIYNLFEDLQAEQAADTVKQELSEEIKKETESKAPAQTEQEVLKLPVDGRDYCGILEIPSLDIEFPIQTELTDEGMKTSPCRYTGWVTSRDLIIAGHNYQSHFGSLRQLESGDSLQFTTAENIIYHYTVSMVEEIPGTDIEKMMAGDWDLTLFTCTVPGTSRVTIRCKLAD